MFLKMRVSHMILLKKTPVIHSGASEEISTMSQIVHRFAQIPNSVIQILFLQTDLRRNVWADTETYNW